LNLTTEEVNMKKRLSILDALRLMLFGGLFAFSTLPAAAQTGYSSFVQEAYYLGEGGTPPSMTAFAANPRNYLRSDAAYATLKQGFERAIGEDLSDQEFSELLASDRVRLVDCVGRIRTAGINPQGTIGWSVRACYSGEQLIEVQVGERWVLVASQGCFNLVQPYIPPEPEEPKNCRFVKTEEVRLPDTFAVVRDFNSCGCFIPGVTARVPGGTQTSSRLVCD